MEHDGKFISCEICNKKFGSQKGIKSHQRIHQKKPQIPDSGKFIVKNRRKSERLKKESCKKIKKQKLIEKTIPKLLVKYIEKTNNSNYHNVSTQTIVTSLNCCILPAIEFTNISSTIDCTNLTYFI